METTNGKDIIIGIYDTPMVDVVVTGLKAPHGLRAAAELVERFVENV